MIIIRILTLNLLLVAWLSAQVLHANVKVDYAHLPAEQQNELEDLQQNVTDYFNNFAWTDDEYETDIDINVQIIIETRRDKSHERIYSAQFLISSTSGEKFYDKDWEFSYQTGYQFDHNKVQIDPLIHFLDYYAYMVLGGELDTYGLFLGAAYYDKARDIANRAVLSRYAKGWDKRIEELDKITHIRTRPLREVKPDFFEAEYYLQEGNIKEAKKYAASVLNGFEKVIKEQPNNKYLRLFFDAHYRVLVDIYRGDNEILNKLVSFDSNHRDAYRAAMNN